MPEPTPRRRLGTFGESVAAAHFTRQGYTIIDRSWRCRSGEIDLVVQCEDTLVFVEVRARRSMQYGSPEESLSRAKQTRLVALAYAYLEAHNIAEMMPWRIDIIALDIDQSGRVARLNHIRNAIEEI